jgi:hypothetical protein
MRLFLIVLLAGCTSTSVPPPTPAVPAGSASPPEIRAQTTDLVERPPDSLVDLTLFATAEGSKAVAVPLFCRRAGEAVAGTRCAPQLSAGAEVTLPELGRTVLGSPATALCSAEEPAAQGFSASVGQAPDYSPRLPPGYGYLGHGAPPGALPEPPRRATATERAQVLAVVQETHPYLLPDTGTDTPRVTVEFSGDLDGKEGRESILSVWRGSEDPDKPGNSALYLQTDSGTLALIDEEEWFRPNGLVVLAGAIPIKGGHALVITSRWMGGSGVYAVALGDGLREYLGGWACGS